MKEINRKARKEIQRKGHKKNFAYVIANEVKQPAP